MCPVKNVADSIYGVRLNVRQNNEHKVTEKIHFNNLLLLEYLLSINIHFICLCY